MKIKYIFILAVAAIVAAMAFQSCSDTEEPMLPEVPERDVYVFNHNDSAVFCDVFKKAYNGYENYICERYNIKLDDISTWSKLCQWVLDKPTKEARIYLLNIYALDRDEYPGYVSSRILELDSLRYLTIKGSGIHGSLPAHPDGKGRLVTLLILQTSMTNIPDEIFQYPDLYEFYLGQNYKMAFPEGVLKIDSTKISPGGEPARFWFIDNGFKGGCPMNVNQYVNLRDNEFTSVDWTGMESKDYWEALKIPRSPGPYLVNNPIRTRVPDYILADTLAIIYVSGCLGFGPNRQIDNFPSDDEIYKMKMEWKKNHPEEAEELGL